MASFTIPKAFPPATESSMPSSYLYNWGKVSYTHSVTVVPGVRSGKKVIQPQSVRAMAVAKFKGTWIREKQLTEMIEKKVMEAKEVCEGNKASDECKVAWDEVEEVSQAKADLRRKMMGKHDPLEYFCQENPETDECRIYED